MFCFQGPIIGFTFGIVVKNPELWKLGVTNELIGLSICLTFGETGIPVGILIYGPICQKLHYQMDLEVPFEEKTGKHCVEFKQHFDGTGWQYNLPKLLVVDF